MYIHNSYITGFEIRANLAEIWRACEFCNECLERGHRALVGELWRSRAFSCESTPPFFAALSSLAVSSPAVSSRVHQAYKGRLGKCSRDHRWDSCSKWSHLNESEQVPLSHSARCRYIWKNLPTDFQSVEKVSLSWDAIIGPPNYCNDILTKRVQKVKDTVKPV